MTLFRITARKPSVADMAAGGQEPLGLGAVQAILGSKPT